jgi:hypothetical protein
MAMVDDNQEHEPIAEDEPDLDDADDLEQFEQQARAAVTRYDSPPSDYSDFARLAIEFRGPALAVEEVDRSFVEIGVRGEGVTMSVEHRGTRLLWRVDEAGLWGTMVPARSVRIELESPTREGMVRVSDRDGSFSFDVDVPTPYRLTVREASGAWTTPWQN